MTWNRKSAALAQLSWILAWMLAGCLEGGGSGTETSNGELVGRVFYPDQSPAAGAQVFVRRDDFLTDTSRAGSGLALADAITDAGGGFRLDSLLPGDYKLEIRDGQGQAVLIDFNLKKGAKTTELAADTLRPVGALSGRVELPSENPSHAYVQVFGMERLVRSDPDGYFLIPDLPAGHFLFRAISSRPGISYLEPAVAQIASKDTARVATLKLVTFADEDYSQWPFTQRIYVNTAAAGVTGTVTDFPLMVELDGSRFDFGLSDGKDVRFSAPDGRHLSYQLDYWDADNQSGVFWVKMDTVNGASREQFFNIHWGKRDAPDFSDGRTVFSDFSGVWHFSEAMDTQGNGLFKDASASGAGGVAHVAPDLREGRIGNGAGFAGSHSVRAPGATAMKPARELTLSAWVWATGSGSFGGEIASMGDNYGLRMSVRGNAWFFIFTDTTRKANTRIPEPFWPYCIAPNPDLRKTGWHHVAVTYDGKDMRLFVDATERVTRFEGKDMVYPFGQEFWMGSHGNGVKNFEFKGSLDEVRVSGKTLSPDWIKLEFESQRAGTPLLEFR